MHVQNFNKVLTVIDDSQNLLVRYSNPMMIATKDITAMRANSAMKANSSAYLLVK